MPEYHIPKQGRVAIKGADHIAGATLGWENLDAFTQGYIGAMFFTENSPAFDKDDIAGDLAAWQHAEREGQSDGTIPGDAAFEDLRKVTAGTYLEMGKGD